VIPDVEVQFNGPCPFCGEPIEETETDPCSLTATTRKELWQVWQCHGECFKKKLLRTRTSISRRRISRVTDPKAQELVKDSKNASS